MATKINRTPTTDINFEQNLTYNDGFATWLTEMVDHWAKNYTGCTFVITKIGSEAEGLSASIKSTPKKNINFDCNSSLEKDLKNVQSNNKITVEKKASELSTIFTVTWKKEGGTTTKKDEKKEKTKEKTKDGKSKDSDSSRESMYDTVFGNFGQKVVQAALAGTQKADGTEPKAAGTESKSTDDEETTNEHYIKNKKLVKEVERIKQLLK